MREISISIGNLDSIVLGEKVKDSRINQDQPEGHYKKPIEELCGEGLWGFFKNYEKETGKKFKLSIKVNKTVDNYLIIERVA